MQALEQNARLKTENAELREEIARLKGLKGRPKLKPSGMDKAAEAGAAKGSRKKGRHRRQAGEAQYKRNTDWQAGQSASRPRFKGYEDFIVQDIVIKPWTVLYRRERLFPRSASKSPDLAQSLTTRSFSNKLKVHYKDAQRTSGSVP